MQQLHPSSALARKRSSGRALRLALHILGALLLLVQREALGSPFFRHWGCNSSGYRRSSELKLGPVGPQDHRAPTGLLHKQAHAMPSEEFEPRVELRAYNWTYAIIPYSYSYV